MQKTIKKLYKGATLFGLTAAILLSSNASFAGDVEKGKKLYRACAMCHSIEADKQKVGPSLHNIMGKPVAAVEGYRYSKAMKESGENGDVWTVATMDAFLKSPRQAVPRTKMGYPGMRKDADRVDLIAYLETLTD